MKLLRNHHLIWNSNWAGFVSIVTNLVRNYIISKIWACLCLFSRSSAQCQVCNKLFQNVKQTKIYNFYKQVELLILTWKIWKITSFEREEEKIQKNLRTQIKPLLSTDLALALALTEVKLTFFAPLVEMINKNYQAVRNAGHYTM